MANMIDQSVPRPQAAAAAPGMDPAMLDYLLGEDQEDAMRQQALVDQLRGYGGGATPQMRGRTAPGNLEYAAVLGNRIAGMGGELGVRNAEQQALEELRRRLYPPTAAAAPAGAVPADPSFGGVGAAPY